MPIQIAIVKFYDPTTFGYWADLDEIDKSRPKVCFAHGRLIQDDDELVKVSLLSNGGKSRGSDWIDIPAGAVISVDVVATVDWEVEDGS